eukprot:COSAG05_NODE_15809_length_360_cov_1.375479_1_plen_64_part_01
MPPKETVKAVGTAALLGGAILGGLAGGAMLFAQHQEHQRQVAEPIDMVEAKPIVLDTPKTRLIL